MKVLNWFAGRMKVVPMKALSRVLVMGCAVSRYDLLALTTPMVLLASFMNEMTRSFMVYGVIRIGIS